jgi:gas vesicle protein
VPTFQQLLIANPAAYQQAGAALRQASGLMRETRAQLEATLAELDTSWSGSAQQAQRDRARRLADQLGQVADALENAAQVVSTGAEQLQAAVTQLRSTVQQATAAGFLVLPTGQVLPGPTHYSQAAAAGPGAPAVLEAYQAVAQAYTAILESIVVQASTLDAAIAARLQAGMAQAAAFAAQQAPAAGLTPQRTEREYGILERNQARFQEFADDDDLVIDVRPTNPASVPWLHRGAIPKPQSIKAKTINDRDVLLGADPRHKGLVGFFRPRMPPQGDLSDAEYASLRKRYDQRVEELTKYRETMADLGRQPVGPGRFEVEDGVVYGYDRTGARQPVAGDHDMFDIRRTDGTRLSEQEYDDLIEEMRDADMGVEHGAVQYWLTRTDDERKIRDSLLEAHKPGGEPLVRFAPGRRPRLVDSDTPV